MLNKPMEQPMYAEPAKDPEALTTDEVRQGETGNGVRYVLAVSLAAALIALVAAWFYVT